MKKSNFLINPVTIILASLGLIMVLTNPGKRKYEEYATNKLSIYLKEEGCKKLPDKFDNFLQIQCKNLIETAKPQIQTLISEKTERQNFFIFSIYQTELALAKPIPDYSFATLGIFNQLYIYKAEEISE